MLRFLATAIGARSVVEIGTGCGSSGIWLLRGMRPGGVLTSVDTEPEYHRLARKAFAQAGFAANQARLILGRASDVLPRLSDGAYDMVFCDADPASYPDYLSAGQRLLRHGGIIVFDDAGTATAEADMGGATEAGTRELAEMVRIDDRLVSLSIPVAGGAARRHQVLMPDSKRAAAPRGDRVSGVGGPGLPGKRLLPSARHGGRTRYPTPTADFRASPSLTASSAESSTTSRPPPSSGTRITMPRPSLVTSSGPSPVRGFIAAILHPLPHAVRGS